MKSRYNTERLALSAFVTNWDNSFPLETYADLVMTLCEEVNSSYSLGIYLCLKYADHDALLQTSPDPTTYNLSLDYLKDAQVMGLVKKYPNWEMSHDRETVTMKKFIDAEVNCRYTNSKIYHGSLSREPRVASIFHTASRIISDLLGDVPTVDELGFQFGPGSCYSVKNNTTAFDKLNSTLDVSPNGLNLATEYVKRCPGWYSDYLSVDTQFKSEFLTVVPGDRLTFVPKDARTDRPICIGPLLNVLLQKAIGSKIRKRLKPVIDLRNAQSNHVRLAQIASKTGDMCTIDLSSASDNISFAVVQNLFPEPWFDLMYNCRSPQYEIDGNQYDFHKFSAMGNGYTFEMESLLFYSICESVRRYLEVPGQVYVYGDDIITPTSCWDLTIEMLHEAGFSVNTEKSFNDGFFRESCGGDYFNGDDVRPFFMKDPMSYRTLFLLHNKFVMKGYNYLFPKTFKKVRKIIGPKVCSALRGNLIENDGYLIDLSSHLVPKWFIEEKPVKRKVPRSSNHYTKLKSFALYRQQFPEYDRFKFLNGKSHLTYALQKRIGKELYSGVSDLKSLPKNAFRKTFKLRSTRNTRAFY